MDLYKHHIATSMVSMVSMLGAVFSSTVAAVDVHVTEMSRAKQFALHSFGFKEQKGELQLPFAFTYSGDHSSQLLHKWQLKRVDEQLDEQRIQHILTYTDSNTSLTVKCVAVEYLDFPVVEWTVYLRNCGDRNTPLLESVRALDINVIREDKAGEYLLHHFKGSQADISDYQWVEMVLSPKTNKTITPFGGLTFAEFAYCGI